MTINQLVKQHFKGNPYLSTNTPQTSIDLKTEEKLQYLNLYLNFFSPFEYKLDRTKNQTAYKSNFSWIFAQIRKLPIF